MRVTPLNCPRNTMDQWRPALVSGSREMQPVSRSLEMKILAIVVHLVEWKSLPKLAAKISKQNSLASSTLDGSMGIVSLMVSNVKYDIRYAYDHCIL